MSDDLRENSYSAFWPLLILTLTFAVMCFFQLYEALAQHSAINQRYAVTATADNMQKAKEAQDHLLALWNDLKAAAVKDQNAAQIVRDITQQGLIRDRGTPGTPGETNAAPAAPANP